VSEAGFVICPRCQLNWLKRGWDITGCPRCEAEQFRSRLSAVEGERDAARKGRIIAELNEREVEARVSELRGLLELARIALLAYAGGHTMAEVREELGRPSNGSPFALAARAIAAIASHPLKTEGDGGTPTTETKGRP